MGPGILVKAILRGSFSLMVFGWAQIVMDMQPLVVLITGEGHLHGFSHTYIGAFLLGLVSAITGKYLAEYGLLIIGISKRENPVNISWFVAVASAFIGTYSHVVLDAILYADLQPLYPLSPENELLGLTGVSELHWLCVYMAIAGGILFFVVQIANKYKRRL